MTTQEILDSLSKVLSSKCPKCGEEHFIPSFGNNQVLYTCSSCGYSTTYQSEAARNFENIPLNYVDLYDKFIRTVRDTVYKEFGDKTNDFFNSHPVKQFFKALRNKVSAEISSGLDVEDLRERLRSKTWSHITSKLIPAFNKALQDGKPFDASFLRS